jgi:hypothetical protein
MLDAMQWLMIEYKTITNLTFDVGTRFADHNFLF